MEETLTNTSYDSELEGKITGIFDKLEDLRVTIKGKERLEQSVQADLDRYVERKNKLDELQRIDSESIEVFKSVIDGRNKSAKDKLESMLNFALSYIPLENNYTIKLEEFDTKRSGREFSIKLFDKNANKLRGVRTQSGTAITQLVSFLVRVVVISFSGARRVLLIDENLSGFQDKETIRMFGEILVALAENENFQILMVEHKSEFNEVPGMYNYRLAREGYDKGVILKEVARIEKEVIEELEKK